MDFKQFMARENEKPLDTLVTNGGLTGIFRTIACIGDSLASGEMESLKDGVKGYHDYYEYSWGQYMARDAGLKVYNFSIGGMSAKAYCETFAAKNNYWSPTYQAQGYIIALGVNDAYAMLRGELEFGDIADIDVADWRNNKPTFVGYYAQIIQRYKEIAPKAKFFLMTMPRNPRAEADRVAINNKHQQLLYKLAELFDSAYVLDFAQYAPVYDAEFDRNFRLGGHLNAAGYRITALMVESYIDYLIRHNPDDFKQVPFYGTDFHNEGEKW